MLPITVRGYVPFAPWSSLDMKNVLFSLTKELGGERKVEPFVNSEQFNLFGGAVKACNLLSFF